MKSFWISEVVLLLLLSVVELEEATSVADVSCPRRNLTAAVDDIMKLYIDGVEITGLPNADIWNQPDVVDLPCTTRLIAIHGENKYTNGEAGILASTDDGYIMTNSTWKCSNVSQLGWEQIDFDDSAWVSALELSWVNIPGINSKAEWIWLRKWNGQEMDLIVYCRKRLDINECLLSAPDNECDPSMGKCIDIFGGYNCRCYEGYTNDGSKRCRQASSTGNYKTGVIILGVLFGVAVLVIVALIIWVCHLRKKTVKEEGADEGQSGITYQAHKNDTAVSDEQTAVDSNA